MRAADPLLSLFGHRAAIERIAATRHAWVVGVLLVLSAGIARNYDHLDLRREAEWFIGPFAASLVSIFFIFRWLAGPLKLRAVGGYWRQQASFLTLAWLTAPCAWLYGIPVEGLTDIVTATKWNIGFLAVVATWRVAIVTRALAVLSGVTVRRALPLVLAPAALEMMVGSFFKSLSLIGIMGGVRLPPHTQLLKEATDFTAAASFWVFLAAVLAACWTRGVAARPLHRPPGAGVKPGLLPAALALALWVLVALPAQPAIANRLRLADRIRSGDYPAAAAFAAAKTREDFPPHQDFPPVSDYLPPLLGLLDALPADAPAWLRDEWTAKAMLSLSGGLPSLEAWQELVRRHPDLAAALARRADELRARESIEREDRRWLEEYELRTSDGAEEAE